MMPTLLKSLSTALDSENLILLIGNDFPQDMTGIPSRAELAYQLASDYKDILSDDSVLLPCSLNAVADRLGRDKVIDLLFKLFRSKYAEDHVKVKMEFYESIVGFLGKKLKYIITTAYDKSISDALNNHGISHNFALTEQHITSRNKKLLTLLHLYGSVDQEDTLVVNTTDHLNFNKIHQEIAEWIRKEFRDNVVLLIGYDLSDLSFLSLHSAIRTDDNNSTTYAIWPGLSDDEKASWKEKKIIILDGAPEGWFNGLQIPVYPQVVAIRHPATQYIFPEYFDLGAQTERCVYSIITSSTYGLFGFAIPCAHNGVMETFCRRLESDLNLEDQNANAKKHETKLLSVSTSDIDEVINDILQNQLPSLQNGDGDVIFPVEVVEQKRVIEFWNALSAVIKKVEETNKLIRRLIVILPIQSIADLPEELRPPLDAPIFNDFYAKKWVRLILDSGKYPSELIDKWVEFIVKTCPGLGGQNGNLDPDLIYSHIQEIGIALRKAKNASPVLKTDTILQVLKHLKE